MTKSKAPFDELASLTERIRELEAQLEESTETLDAIRRGEIDALVITGPEEHRIYTLETADRPYQAVVEQMQEGAVTLGEDGTILYCNRRLALLLEVPQERVIGQPLSSFLLPDDVPLFARLLADARRGGRRSELALCTSRAESVPVYMSLSALNDGGRIVCGVLTDLREQQIHVRELADANVSLKNEIAERERLEEILRHSQKMEAVGQLTGGLAHDFNNMLAGVVGSLELMTMRLEQGRIEELSRYMKVARDAADRAASLTHRLLAFSRRQTLSPEPTDANRLIGELEELIRRTMGPAILTETVFASGLWPTLCDPSQLGCGLNRTNR
ncbi:MAG TPA: PAS domain-containing protein [Stellaceae bacterium]|jgi:PAS domain S-box-containing protein|nr:PAS domain-containing protein [Stellaceae bacterium]